MRPAARAAQSRSDSLERMADQVQDRAQGQGALCKAAGTLDRAVGVAACEVQRRQRRPDLVLLVERRLPIKVVLPVEELDRVLE